MTVDFFAGALTSVDQLDDLYEPPTANATAKVVDHIDDMTASFIAAASLVFVGSTSRSGQCDVSPRGGPPGFVTVLDETHLAIPDATGNRRVDTLRNVIETGRVGLVFLIPGRGQTLRVNGEARVIDNSDILTRLTAVGKPPRSALVVKAEEVYTHCPKAFVRSKTWDPESWVDNAPPPAEVSHAHLRDPALSVADVEQSQRESLLYRLE